MFNAATLHPDGVLTFLQLNNQKFNSLTLFPTHSAWGGTLFFLKWGAQAMFGIYSHNKQYGSGTRCQSPTLRILNRQMLLQLVIPGSNLPDLPALKIYNYINPIHMA